MQSRLAPIFTVVLGLSCSAQRAAPPPETQAKQSKAPEPVAAYEEEIAPGLEEHQIIPVVESENGAVRGCHTIEYAGRDQTGGTMTVDLYINPDGSVADVSVSDSDFDSEPMQRCVMDVTRRLRFPKAPGSTELSWRFKFNPPQG